MIALGCVRATEYQSSAEGQESVRQKVATGQLHIRLKMCKNTSMDAKTLPKE